MKFKRVYFDKNMSRDLARRAIDNQVRQLRIFIHSLEAAGGYIRKCDRVLIDAVAAHDGLNPPKRLKPKPLTDPAKKEWGGIAREYLKRSRAKRKKKLMSLRD